MQSIENKNIKTRSFFVFQSGIFIVNQQPPWATRSEVLCVLLLLRNSWENTVDAAAIPRFWPSHLFILKMKLTVVEPRTLGSVQHCSLVLPWVSAGFRLAREKIKMIVYCGSELRAQSWISLRHSSLVMFCLATVSHNNNRSKLVQQASQSFITRQ